MTNIRTLLVFLLCFVKLSFSQNIDIQSIVSKNTALGLEVDFINSYHYSFVDIDSDGDLDLHAISVESSLDGLLHAKLYLNDGEGNFSVIKDSGLPSYIKNANFADFDADGDIDVFIKAKDFELYLNDGALKFSKKSVSNKYRNKTCRLYESDLNGDNLVDVLVVIPSIIGPGGFGSQDAETHVFFNKGGGEFTLNQEPIRKVINAEIVLIFDLDLDGVNEILTFDNDNVWVYENNGADNFDFFTLFDGDEIDYSFSDATAKDINKDGKIDLLVSGSDGGHIYYNQGNLFFEEQFRSPFLKQMQRGHVFLEDLEGDGDIDIIHRSTSMGANRLSMYTNDAGVFTELLSNLNESYEDLIFADVNGDNLLDILSTSIASNSNALSNELYLCEDLGSYITTKSEVLSSYRFDRISTADVDNDGDLDFIAGGHPQSEIATSLFINKGDGTFSISQENNFARHGYMNALFSDLDQDNDIDLLLSRSDTAIVYFNNSKGLYSEREKILLDEFSDVLAFIDFDSDGDQDIISSVRDHQELRVYYNDNGAFGFPLNTGIPFRDYIYFTDMDGDSDLDIFSGEGEACFFYENDNGAPYKAIQLSGITLLENARIQFADFNNDGELDFLCAGNTNSFPKTEMYWGRGSGFFDKEASQQFMNADKATMLDIDIDNDGDIDLILSGKPRYGDAVTKLYLNDGKGVFSEWVDHPIIALNSGVMLKGDLDGDQDLDIIIAGDSKENIQLRLYENRTCWPIPPSNIEFDGKAMAVSGGDYHYQWINCDNQDTFLQGKTKAVFYPYQIGSYAVIVSNNNCSVVSDCFEFTESDLNNASSRLYPNPSNEAIILEAPPEDLKEIRVYSYLGKEVTAQITYDFATSTTVQLNISALSSGLYFVKTVNEFLKFSKF